MIQDSKSDLKLLVSTFTNSIRNYLQSPYFFMCCNLWDAVEERAAQTDSQSVLAGTLVSSLHRLKDIDNQGKRATVEDHSLAGY